jgi:hypothetical protein
MRVVSRIAVSDVFGPGKCGPLVSFLGKERKIHHRGTESTEIKAFVQNRCVQHGANDQLRDDVDNADRERFRFFYFDWDCRGKPRWNKFYILKLLCGSVVHFIMHGTNDRDSLDARSGCVPSVRLAVYAVAVA